jgi:hypothetical protein
MNSTLNDKFSSEIEIFKMQIDNNVFKVLI